MKGLVGCLNSGISKSFAETHFIVLFTKLTESIKMIYEISTSLISSLFERRCQTKIVLEEKFFTIKTG